MGEEGENRVYWWERGDDGVCSYRQKTSVLMRGGGRGREDEGEGGEGGLAFGGGELR